VAIRTTASGGSLPAGVHLLPQNGMAVLCYDPIGQGERNQLLDGKGKRSCRNHRAHDDRIGALLVVRARRPTAFGRHRSLDYLTSRPEIDPQRWLHRNSGGGTMTAYLMASTTHCGGGAFVLSHHAGKALRHDRTADAEQNITASRLCMEHADYLAMRARVRPSWLSPPMITSALTGLDDISGSQLVLASWATASVWPSSSQTSMASPSHARGGHALARRWLVGKDDAPVEATSTSFKTPSCNAPVAAR